MSMIALAELQRIAGQLDSLQLPDNSLALYVWDSPDGILTDDAVGLLNRTTEEICYLRSTLWRVANVSEYRGCLAVGIGHQMEHILKVMRGSGGSGIEFRNDTLNLLVAAGNALMALPDVMKELWGADVPDQPMLQGDCGLVAWLSVLVTLAERGKFVGNADGKMVGKLWHWQCDGAGRCCYSYSPDSEELPLDNIDTSRRAAIIGQPIVASRQALVWILDMAEKLRAKRVAADSNGIPTQILVDLFAHAMAIGEKLRMFRVENGGFGPASYDAIREELDFLKGELYDIGLVVSQLPDSIQTKVVAIANIVNDSLCNIGYADVCESFANSEIETIANTGWTQIIKITKPPAVKWASNGRAEKPYTLGTLISEVGMQERFLAQAAEKRSKIDPTCKVSGLNQWYENSANRECGQADKVCMQYWTKPGVDRLRNICSLQGNKWSKQWLEQQRAAYCLKMNAETKAANALSVVEFAEWLMPSNSDEAKRSTICGNDGDDAKLDSLPLAGPPFTVNEELSQIRANGKSHDVPSEAARMAKLLLDNIGEWVSMAKNGFTKPSTTKRQLPTAVQSLIETETGKGYRIRRSM